MFCKPTLRQQANSAIKRILVKSDMLTTRATVATSSLVFAAMLSFGVGEISDQWFWIVLSLIHGTTSLWSLLCDKINRLTFVGEAFLGFILWNYIGMFVLTSSSVSASNAPTFVVGMATWWILARYPVIRKHRRNRY